MAFLTIKRSVVLILVIALILGVLAFLRIQRQLEVRDSTWGDFAEHIERDIATKVACANPGTEGAPGAVTAPALTDASGRLGGGMNQTTFALSVADLNDDKRDDILIGAHGKLPHLLMNRGDSFENLPHAIFAPGEPVPDLHGYTLADLDGDSDLDIAIAAGGANGIGDGSGNMFFRNVGDRSAPVFRREPVSAELANRRGRSRAYLPVASADGRSVDLYYTTLARKGVTNALLVNQSNEAGFSFRADETSPFTRVIKDHGVGTLADFDGNGHLDYLVVDGPKLKIYWSAASGRQASTFAYNTATTVTGDFNNDGLLDIYIGRYIFDKAPDLLAHSPRNIVFDIQMRGPQAFKQASFGSDSLVLQFSLDDPPSLQEVMPDKNPGTIYLGRDRTHPPARKFSLARQEAMGEPAAFEEYGTYIWFSETSGQWHIRWQLSQEKDHYTGTIEGLGLTQPETEGLVAKPSAPQRDTVLVNRGNGRFRELCNPLPPHGAFTSGLTVADLNSDGWLDIAGVRHGRVGERHGELFILVNQSGGSFAAQSIDLQAQDLLARPDKVVHGFFDGDTLPDLVVTTGFGYGGGMGPRGEPRLFLNSTPGAGGSLALDLVGLPGNREALGARVSLYDSSDRLLGQRTRGLNANLSQDTHVVHFGLGDTAPPYRAVVEWADGSTTTGRYEQAGRYTLQQGSADN